MKPYKDFIVSPMGDRYNNSKKIGDKNLILNTDIYNHQFVNRKAKVIATPLLLQSPINVGDEVIIHHNVFRRWNNMKGVEKNSRSYLRENEYLITLDQLYLYKKEDWMVVPGYSYIKPLLSDDNTTFGLEKELVGVVKYSDNTFNKNEIVGYRPKTVVEDFVNGERLYRIMNKFITIKYGYKRNEEEYNPSWA
jgi:hypothetical protein